MTIKKLFPCAMLKKGTEHCGFEKPDNASWNTRDLPQQMSKREEKEGRGHHRGPHKQGC